MKCKRCNHEKHDHSIGLDGSFGPCNKEIVAGWLWCDCKEFLPDDRHLTTTCTAAAKFKSTGLAEPQMNVGENENG